jgi:hypothetical protein
MRDHAPLVLLVAVLAFFGFRALPSAPGETGGKAQTPGRDAAVTPNPASELADSGAADFRQPLIDFYTSSTGKKRERENEGHPWPSFPDVPEWESNFLIALVADPIDSSFGYQFDAAVDAIQRAVETQGYVLDRPYYPWPQPSSAAKTSEASSASTLDYTFNWFGMTRTPRKPEAERTYEQQPGVLLFRAPAKPAGPEPAKPQRLLVVFLVGETATAGIHKQAFTAALNLIRQSKQQEGKPILVLGPCTSGARRSLQAPLQIAIRKWAQEWLQDPESRRPLPEFQIVSGSATAFASTVQEIEEFQSGCWPASLTFQATVIPEELVFRALLRYLKLVNPREWLAEQPALRQDVAVLCESNTAFGRNFIEAGQKLKRDSSDQTRGGSRPGRLVVFPFPMRISELRAGYLKVGENVPTSLPSLPSLRGKLSVPLEELDSARDIEPTLHPSMATVMNELTLEATLLDLAHERYKYVVITASNIKDQIFLATLVRKYCPDVQLLFTTGDLILSHPDYTYYMRGALVGSSYPLYAKNQRWSLPYRGTNQRFVFSSQLEYGYYNATLALLQPDEAKDLLEYGVPFGEAKPGNTPARRPPIWISTIGQNGPEPLEAYYPEQEAADSQGGKELYDAYVFEAADEPTEAKPEFSPQHTTLWIVPFLLFTLFAAVVSGSYAYVLWRTGSKNQTEGTLRPEPDSGLVGLFWPRRTAALRADQRYYTWVVSMMAVFLGYFYLVRVWDIPALQYLLFSQTFIEFHWWNGLIPLATLLLLGSIPALGVVALVRRRRERKPAPRPKPTEMKAAGRPRGLGRRIRGLLPGLKEVRERASGLLHRQPVRLLSLGLLVIMVGYLLMHWEEPPMLHRGHESLFFFERATNLPGGVSPVVPVVLIALAFFWFGSRELKRIYLLDKHRVDSPFPEPLPEVKDGVFKDIHDAHETAQSILERPQTAGWSWRGLVVWLVLFFTFCRLASRFVPTVEGVWFDSLLLLALAVFTLLVVRVLLQAFALWKSVRTILQAAAKLPMREAYSRLPRRITQAFGPYLSSDRPGRYALLEERQKQHRRLVGDYEDAAHVLQTTLGYSDTQMKEKVDTELHRPAAPDQPRPRTDLETRDAARQELRESAVRCLRVLDQFWNQLTIEEAFCDAASAAGAAARDGREHPSDHQGAAVINEAASVVHRPKEVRRWLEAAEDFVALEIISYLSQYFVQLRNLLLFLTVGPLLLLFAVTSYPLQPQRLWLLAAGALIIAVTFVALRIFVQIERDELVSRISGTTPNRLSFSWSFLGSVVKYALPLVGILAAASTDLSDALRTMLDPIIRVLK